MLFRSRAGRRHQLPWIQRGKGVQVGSKDSKGTPGMAVESLDWARVQRDVPGGSGSDWGRKGSPRVIQARLGSPGGVPEGLGCSGVTRRVPRGSGPDRGCEGHPRGLWAARDRDSQGSLRRCNPAGVVDGGGAPPPHIKARESGGRAQSGAGGRRAGAERPGPRRAGPGGRVREGRREGERGPGGRRGLRWGGAAVPHLIVHGWRPAPPPGQIGRASCRERV